MNENEVDKFFGGLKSEDKQAADIFNDKKLPEKVEDTQTPEKEEEVETEGEETVRKNRRHRRLEEALQRERESNIALNARIQALAEGQRVSNQAPAEGNMPPEWAALYGTSIESQKAWEIQERLLQQQFVRAKEEVVNEFEQRQVQSQKELKQFESFIDEQLETLEDEHNVDLTSDSPKARKARREFLGLVQSLSPKDEDGTITDYADFGSVFDVYQKTSTQDRSSDTVTRQKEIASRSMQKSGQNTVETKRITPGFWGWKKDLNIN